MNSRMLLTGVIGALVVFFIWSFIAPSAAGIVFILVLTLLISMWISEDAAKHRYPEIFASLSEDAQTIIVENLGRAAAASVQVKVIPDDIRYEIGDLSPDTSHQYQLPSMLREGKAAVSWEKKDGTRTEKIFRLSGYSGYTDPLRPTFPLFSWKEK